MTHRITVGSGALRFAAAHFATFGGGCEPLHGHNYNVSLEVSGQLTCDRWVMDFAQAKAIGCSICGRLDHKFLLQAESTALEIDKPGKAYRVSFGDRHYVMPASDVIALPIENSTAELLAEWFAGEFVQGLAARGAANIESVTVGIEESPGAAGWYTLRCGGPQYHQSKG